MHMHVRQCNRQFSESLAFEVGNILCSPKRDFTTFGNALCEFYHGGFIYVVLPY